MESLRESFRAPFVQTAWQRHSRVASWINQGEGVAGLRSAAAELHCLVSEASMLAFKDVAQVARVAEQAAREGDRVRLTELVRELHMAIKAVEEGTTTS